MEKFYYAIDDQNHILNEKTNKDNFREKKEETTTNDQTISYLSKTVIDLRFVIDVMFYIYMFLVLILTYFLYINKTIFWKSKIATISFLLIFPFFINSFQDNLRYLYNFLFSASTNVNTVSIKEKDPDSITQYKFKKHKGKFIKREVLDRGVTYHVVENQNALIDNQVENIQKKAVTNFRHSEFFNGKADYYKSTYKILFYVYYICVLGFLYELFVNDSMKIDIYKKMALVLVIGTYPFYCDFVSKSLIFIGTLLYSFMMSKTYKHPYDQYNSDK